MSEPVELIAILEDIQARHGYLPADMLRKLADDTGRPLVDIYGVATFYRSFSLKPRGKHLCSVCVGTACHVRGAPEVASEFSRRLDVRSGETTGDRQFTLETVNCLGACALGPIVGVDGRYFSNVHRTKVKEILAEARNGLDRKRPDGDERVFPVELACPRCNHSLMDPGYPIDGHPSIRVTLAFGRKHGCLRLSSLYGSYSTESDHEVPMGALVNIFCPHCHTELRGGGNCPECGEPMVPMIVRGGGVVQVCPRRGCRGHMLDLDSAHF